MRKEPFVVALRECHGNYDFLMLGPSSESGISMLPALGEGKYSVALAILPNTRRHRSADALLVFFRTARQAQIGLPDGLPSLGQDKAEA